MIKIKWLLSVVLMTAVVAPVMADISGFKRVYSSGQAPRSEALIAIEADRDAVINSLATEIYGAESEDAIALLSQMENHELIDLMVGGEEAEAKQFGTVGDFANMVYTALESPCRILDTRKYNPGGSRPIGAGVAREVWSHNINGQGGSAGCTGPLAGKSALVLALSAFSPSFPGTFAGPGYGTLLDGAVMGSGWSPIANLPSGHEQFNFDTPPYADAVSVVWDGQTALIETLAIVTTEGPNPEVVLFSSGQAHYAIDVVGFFEDPQLCSAGTTFIDGLCWTPQQGAAAASVAAGQCGAVGGSLPPTLSVWSAVANGELPEVQLWVAGWFEDDDDTLNIQTEGVTLAASNEFNSLPYRCVYTPLTQP